MNTEDAAINAQALGNLKGYKRLLARIKLLEKYPIGNGMYLTSFHEDDKLQSLHKQLKGIPSYMYLSKHEQELEAIAVAYLEKYPTGTRSQLNEVKSIKPVNEEDRKMFKELKRKIEKVIEARTGSYDGYDGVIKRLSELQDLQKQKETIEFSLDVLAEYQPDYAQLLRLRYIESKSVDEITIQLDTSRRTFDRWLAKANEEYAALASVT
ncbi:RNA polymerase subunit sigma-24 [Paenibacillus psychroresistens]|uniref:RNA polymerase subunit sigma-24 n=1 Tax=Paenibacillus psychroresistens TaxID=1778678 RepID=A0A6B8RCB1_9BACL|nr:RNA polymerase subunit sigma-24 [Paenibacillus psychroresistens]QGQ93949.1 RNA polymerase subunit sigma-24 [Paenibacillus psychroresistens]